MRDKGTSDVEALTVTSTTQLGDATGDTVTVYGNMATSGNPTFDYSGSTGTFKTSTGISTLGGMLIYGQTAQTLTGAGAVDITSAITHVVTTAADALTLADGTEGQRKFIVMKTDAGDGTLTPTNLGNGSTITFDDVGDSSDLIFTNAAWHMIGGSATLA